MDTCYAAVELWPSGGIQIRQGDTAFVTVHLAVDEFFHSANGTIDLVTENAAHGNNLPLALKFTDNVGPAASPWIEGRCCIGVLVVLAVVAERTRSWRPRPSMSLISWNFPREHRR